MSINQVKNVNTKFTPKTKGSTLTHCIIQVEWVRRTSSEPEPFINQVENDAIRK